MKLYDMQGTLERLSPHVERINGLVEAIAEANAKIAAEEDVISNIRREARISVNEFGQEIVASDYGDDDLNWTDPDLSVADEMIVEHRTTTAIMALVEGDAQAYQIKRQIEPEVEERAHPVIALIADLDPNEKAYVTHLREPDMYDEGFMSWIGPEAVVSVPVEKRRAFNGYVRCRGLARCDVYKIERLTKDAQIQSVWSLIEQTCTTR